MCLKNLGWFLGLCIFIKAPRVILKHPPWLRSIGTELKKIGAVVNKSISKRSQCGPPEMLNYYFAATEILKIKVMNKHS